MNFVIQKAGKEKKYINYKKNAKYDWQFVATRNYCFTSRVNTL